MSWAEVKIINDNFKIPLNVQIEKIGIVRSWLFETTTTWTPPYSGKYRIFCIGAGGDGEDQFGGGAGGAGKMCIRDCLIRGMHHWKPSAHCWITTER